MLVQSAQAPLKPHVAEALPAAHRCVAKLQQVPPEQVPFPTLPQVSTQAPPAQVGAPPAHAEQLAPWAPQAAFCVPATHAPLEQQPPLHAV